jgi:hypothetical protein
VFCVLCIVYCVLFLVCNVLCVLYCVFCIVYCVLFLVCNVLCVCCVLGLLQVGGGDGSVSLWTGDREREGGR